MSTTDDTPDCPNCDEPMKPWTVTERNTAVSKDHAGFRCPDCPREVIDCLHCGELHHPDNICEPVRDARRKRAQQRFGGTAEIPGQGTVPVSDLEIVGESTPIYVVENACHEDDCNGDLVYTLERNPDFDNPHIPEAEYQVVGEHCDNANGEHPTCDYSKP